MSDQDQDTPLGVERALLGALLLAPEKLQAIRERVAPGDFNLGKHRAIYEAMVSMPGKVDLPTLTDQLKKAGKGEAASYLSELLGDMTYTTANVAEYARRIRENSRAMETRTLLLGSLDKLKDKPGDYRAILDQLKAGAEDQIRAADREGAAVPSMREVLAQVEEEIWGSHSKPIPTFSQGINQNLNGGLQGGKVYTIAGKAGGGKTTLALQILEEITQDNSKKAKGEPLDICLYIHLEQGRAELLVKSYSRLGKINSGCFEEHTVKPGDELVKKARETYANRIAPYFYVVEGGEGSTLRDVRAQIRKVDGQIKGAHQLIVCVDPFQRLRTGDRDLDMEEISKVGAVASGLKIMARELKVAVILLSDTTKAEVVKMEEGEASPTAIRGSYMPEHTTDVSAVILRYDNPDRFPQDRSEAYKKLEEYYRAYIKTPAAEDEAAVYAELVFSKNRSGRTLPVPFLWKRAYNQFIPVEKLRGDE